jgi:hypothetical protein
LFHKLSFSNIIYAQQVFFPFGVEESGGCLPEVGHIGNARQWDFTSMKTILELSELL